MFPRKISRFFLVNVHKSLSEDLFEKGLELGKKSGHKNGKQFFLYGWFNLRSTVHDLSNALKYID
jgi:hypothetical protein